MERSIMEPLSVSRSNHPWSGHLCIFSCPPAWNTTVVFIKQNPSGMGTARERVHVHVCFPVLFYLIAHFGTDGKALQEVWTPLPWGRKETEAGLEGKGKEKNSPTVFQNLTRWAQRGDEDAKVMHSLRRVLECMKRGGHLLRLDC